MTLPPLYILAHAASDRRLDNSSVRVLVYLAVRLDAERFTRVVIADPARALGYRRGVAARALRQLAALGYLEEGPAPRYGRRFRLCTTLPL